MALCSINFYSPALKRTCPMQIILPEEQETPGPYPVYYLLHGGAGDYTNWVRNTSLELYVRNLPLIVVMPDSGWGMFFDMVDGSEYERHFIEDVLGFVDRFYHTIPERAGRVIGGLSLGGYAALRLALKYPDLFCSTNAHSTGFVSLWSRPDRIGKWDSHFQSAFDRHRAEFLRMVGPSPWQGNHCLFRAAEEADRAHLPAIRFDCGVDDFNLEDHRIFHSYLTELEIPHQYEEYPGSHEWSYWDRQIQTALEFHKKALKL